MPEEVEIEMEDFTEHTESIEETRIESEQSFKEIETATTEEARKEATKKRVESAKQTFSKIAKSIDSSINETDINEAERFIDSIETNSASDIVNDQTGQNNPAAKAMRGSIEFASKKLGDAYRSGNTESNTSEQQILDQVKAELQEAVKNGIKTEIDKAYNKLPEALENATKKMNEMFEKNGQKQSLVSRLGEKASEGVMKLLAMGAMAGLGYLILKAIGDGMSGCYKYVKPNPGIQVSKGCGDQFKNDENQKYCGCPQDAAQSKEDCNKDDQSKYVYCVSNCSEVFSTSSSGFCSQDITKSGAVMYSYLYYSPWDVFSNAASGITEDIVDIFKDTTGFIKTLLTTGKWILIIIGVLFAIGLLVGILKNIFSKSQTSGGGTDRIIYIQNPSINPLITNKMNFF
jgi:hypothetical protein